jgi:hypothetical protein
MARTIQILCSPCPRINAGTSLKASVELITPFVTCRSQPKKETNLKELACAGAFQSSSEEAADAFDLPRIISQAAEDATDKDDRRPVSNQKRQTTLVQLEMSSGNSSGRV